MNTNCRNAIEELILARLSGGDDKKQEEVAGMYCEVIQGSNNTELIILLSDASDFQPTPELVSRFSDSEISKIHLFMYSGSTKPKMNDLMDSITEALYDFAYGAGLFLCYNIPENEKIPA